MSGPARAARAGPRGPDAANFTGRVISAVSKPNFAIKYAFESSRRDLHNTLLYTALQSHFFVKILPKNA